MSVHEAKWSNELIEFLNAIEPARVEINRIAGVEMVSLQDVIMANLRKRTDAQKVDHIRDKKINPMCWNRTNPLLNGLTGRYGWIEDRKAEDLVRSLCVLNHITLTPAGEYALMEETEIGVWLGWQRNLRAAKMLYSGIGNKIRELNGCIALTDEGVVYSVAEPSCSA